MTCWRLARERTAARYGSHASMRCTTFPQSCSSWMVSNNGTTSSRLTSPSARPASRAHPPGPMRPEARRDERQVLQRLGRRPVPTNGAGLGGPQAFTDQTELAPIRLIAPLRDCSHAGLGPIALDRVEQVGRTADQAAR